MTGYGRGGLVDKWVKDKLFKEWSWNTWLSLCTNVILNLYFPHIHKNDLWGVVSIRVFQRERTQRRYR